MTVLFSDIAGSTALAERLGADELHELLEHFFATAETEIAQHHGEVSSRMGDGLMAVFGATAGGAEHADAAVAAAFAIRAGLRAADAGIEVRQGVNTGRVVLAPLGGSWTAVGDTVNVAARVQGMAAPSEILVTEETARLVSGQVALRPAGDVRVRGRRAPVTLHRVADLRRGRVLPPAARGAVPLLGRDAELRRLREALEAAAAGRGRALAIVGEAGIGKSRLLGALRLSAEGAWLEARCRPHASAVPLLPIAELLRAVTGVDRDGAPAAVAERLRRVLADVGMSPEDEPIVMQPLGAEAPPGMSPGRLRARIFDTVPAVLLASAGRRPLVIAVEDLHWADPTSRQLLGAVAARAADAPLLLIVTSRPEPPPSWLALPHADAIRLGPLPADAARRLARQHVDDPELAGRLCARAAGNPFFLLALTEAVGQGGAERHIPPGVEGAVMSSVDRLSTEARQVLAAASVCGSAVPRRLLGAVAGLPELQRCLAELHAAGLLEETGSAADGVESFRHSIVQEVMYESLLARERRRLHVAAGEALREFSGDRDETLLEQLARHFERGRRPHEAVAYLRRLGDAAARRHAHTEAADAYRRARGCAAEMGGEAERARLDLSLALVNSLWFLGRFAEAREALDDERGAARRSGGELGARHAFWTALVLSHVGDGPAAIDQAQLALRRAPRARAHAIVGCSHYVLAREEMWRGRYADGLAHARRAAGALEGQDEDWWLAHARIWVGMNLHGAGEHAAALDAFGGARRIAEELADRALESYVAWATGWTLATAGAADAAVAECRRAVELAPGPLLATLGRAALGFALTEAGDPEAARAPLVAAIADMERYGYERLVCWYTAWLAECERRRDARREARRLAVAGRALARRRGSPWAESVCVRTLGRIALDEGRPAEALRRLTAARDRFAAIGASHERRVTEADLRRAGVPAP